MGWEVEKLHRTLMIEKLPKAGGDIRYAISPFMRVTTDEGQTYLEPVPYEGFVSGTKDIYTFDEVVFIDPPVPTRGADASDIGLTNYHPNMAVRKTA